MPLPPCCVLQVDLAGSERVHKTRSEGLVLREAGQINKSLSILEQVSKRRLRLFSAVVLVGLKRGKLL